MGSDLARLEALFGAARRLSPEERGGYLASECGSDAELRREVDDLLEAHDAAGDPDRVHARLPGLPPVAIDVAREVTPAPGAPGGLPTVEGFRTVSRLAEGGMGTVYVAEQARPKRLVALKVLRPEAATPEGLRRFEREAEVLARLTHPGVARVLLHGMTTGPGAPQPFLAMELVEGKPLTQATAALGMKARVAVLADVAEAVAHAHAKGVIHRDLKPDNILVQADGRPKVVDFGVARLADGADTMRTRAGYMIGTLAYMSPEQARGDVAGVDTRSDVYSLGVVAYEVLCLRHPLGERQGTFTEILRRILEERPPEPEQVDPALRGDLTLILRKALAKDPADRYAGASALAEDLRRHLADEPILARPPTGAYLVRRFLRRHKAFVAGSALAVVLLAAGLVVALSLVHSERQANRRAETSAAATRKTLAERSLEIAQLALREHDVENALRALEQVPADLRAWEWRHLATQTDASLSSEPLPAGTLIAASLGPDGASWQARMANGSRLVRKADDAVPRRFPKRPGVVLRTVARAGERLVALLQGGTKFEIADENGEHVLDGALQDGEFVQSMAYAPDGRRLAVAQHGGKSYCDLSVYDAASGAREWRTGGSMMETRALTFSPDGHMIASASGWDGLVRLLDVEAKRSIGMLSGHTKAANALAFSPDGTALASASDDRTVRLWELAGMKERVLLAGHQGAVLAVAFSPNGKRLATASEDGTVRVWDSGTGAAERVFHGHRGAVRAVAFAGGDDVLVSLGADGRRTWRISADRDTLRFHSSDLSRKQIQYPYVYAARFSPDGLRLASAGWDHTVRVVDVASRTLTRTLTLPGNPVLDVCWSGDGRTVIGAKIEVVAWDVESGSEVARWAGKQNAKSLVPLADGKRLLAADVGGTVRVLALPTLTPVATWQTGRVVRLDAAPDDRTFALVTMSGAVQVRGMDDGEVRWSRPAHGGGEFGAVAYSRDGRLLASGGTDRTVRIWDAATGTLVRMLEGHSDPVYSLAWLPDASRLFSGDRRGLIRVWDPETGRACLELRGHSDYVMGLDVAPDGNTVVSASGDNTVRLWTAAARTEAR